MFAELWQQVAAGLLVESVKAVAPIIWGGGVAWWWAYRQNQQAAAQERIAGLRRCPAQRQKAQNDLATYRMQATLAILVTVVALVILLTGSADSANVKSACTFTAALCTGIFYTADSTAARIRRELDAANESWWQ